MQDNNMQGEDRKVYEVGYLLVPTVPEEHLAAEIGNIKSAIDGQGGSFVSEDFPKLRGLAYEIAKKIDAVQHRFNNAYFGWVKFELEPEKLAMVKEALDHNKNVLRFLLITTVKENTLVGAKLGERERKPRAEKTEGNDKPLMSEEEIDKTIEKLVIE